jgi:lipoprotein-anchoring transpeptidase ErfK/SrfK
VRKVATNFMGAFGALLLASTSHAAAPAPEKPAFDRSILHIQVILDKLGFAPGVLDGMGGKSLVAALKGFQTANNLTVSGKPDAETLKALYPYRNWRPTVTLPLSADVLAGPFVNPLPKDPLEQARLPTLGYRNAVEALAERFHTTPATLVTLNPGARLAVGTRLTFPNALPTSRAYDVKDATWLATLQSLNVGAIQPKAKRIVVDKSESVLQVYDDKDKLVAQFPATMGSTHDPLPIGNWTIKGISYNPKFHYNASLFWDADNKDEKATLPPGPNGPVGVVWIDLSKPHYGIHGTPSPETISRAESHGCIRLTNWDAARLALMVKSGVPAVFQP